MTHVLRHPCFTEVNLKSLLTFFAASLACLQCKSALAGGAQVSAAYAPAIGILSTPRGGKAVTGTIGRPLGLYAAVESPGEGIRGFADALLSYSPSQQGIDLSLLNLGIKISPDASGLTVSDQSANAKMGTRRMFDPYLSLGAGISNLFIVYLDADEQLQKLTATSLGAFAGVGTEVYLSGTGDKEDPRFADWKGLFLFGEVRVHAHLISTTSPALQSVLLTPLFGARYRL